MALIGEQPPRIRVGTSGWSYEDWRGIVYPEHPRPRDELRFLAGYVGALEVNSSFYRPATARMTESWLRRTADLPDFRFTFKLHQRFTHQRGSLWTKAEADEYRQGVHPVAAAGRLGAVLMQFPWSFRYLPENCDWLRRLADAFRGWPLVVEVRHDSWLAAEAAALLSELEMTMANIDQPQLEHCIAPSGQSRGGLAYVRLHGRNSRHWWGEEMSSHERYNYLYSEQELDEWVERIRGLGSQSREVYVFTNNHYRGQAPANAFEIMSKLQGHPVAVPEPMLAHYPRLKRVARHTDDDPGRQRRMF